MLTARRRKCQQSENINENINEISRHFDLTQLAAQSKITSHPISRVLSRAEFDAKFHTISSCF